MAGGSPSWLYKSTSANSGTYAASIGSVGFGFAQVPVNGILVNGKAILEKLIPDEIVYQSGGGTPISIKPIKLKGYYKYEIAFGPDHAEAIVLLSKYNQQTNQRDTVGYGSLNLNAAASYTPFTVDIYDWMPTEMPDTITVLFYASDKNNVKKLNLLYVDDINLCGPSPLQLGSDTSIMAGQSVVLDAGSGYAGYLWSDNSTGSTLNVTSSGQYIVTITDSSNCVYSDSILITVLCPPSSLNLGEDTSITNGQLLTLDAGTGYVNYLWSTGDTTQTIHASTTGAYVVTVTDSNNCQYSDTIAVTVVAGIHNVNNAAQNLMVFPNPAKDKISFSFTLNEEATVAISIYNVLFKEIGTVEEKNFTAGKHTVSYNIQSLAEGIYYYKLRTGSTTIGGKLVIER
jgi:hypothetical protein